MIYRCSYCGYNLKPALKDGLTTCDNCCRIVSTNYFHHLLFASWVVRKEHIDNVEALKYRCDLSDADSQLIIDLIAIQCYSQEEFEKYLLEAHFHLDQTG